MCKFCVTYLLTYFDDAAAVVDTLVAIANSVLLVDAADLVRRLRPPIRKMKCRITIGLQSEQFDFSGILEFVIGVLVHRGNGNRAYGLSRILFSGF